jgi:hypothetical protein
MSQPRPEDEGKSIVALILSYYEVEVWYRRWRRVATKAAPGSDELQTAQQQLRIFSRILVGVKAGLNLLEAQGKVTRVECPDGDFYDMP